MLSKVELGRISYNAAKQINKNMSLDERLELISKITHFNHALKVAKKLPTHSHHFLHLIENSNQARLWINNFPSDVFTFPSLIQHIDNDKDFINIVTHNKKLLKVFKHCISVYNAGTLLTLCPHMAKYIIITALENNRGELHRQSSWVRVKYNSNIANDVKHHLDYLKHLFVL